MAAARASITMLRTSRIEVAESQKKSSGIKRVLYRVCKKKKKKTAKTREGYFSAFEET